MNDLTPEEEYCHCGDLRGFPHECYPKKKEEPKVNDQRFKILFEGLSPYQMELIETMKYHAARISDQLENLNKSREVALAHTNLEQGMMWAIKAVCLEADVK